MKKFLKVFAALLALVMVLSLAACSNKTPDPTQGTSAPPASQPGTEESAAPSQSGEENPSTSVTDPNAIDDNPTSADGKYEIAMITDVGSLKDKSFNEGTWNGVKLYAANNNKTYKYYQPANGNEATDDDRYNAYIAAIDAGAKVIVAPGFLQEGAMKKAAEEHPEVNFVFIDGGDIKAGENGEGDPLPNVAGILFQEEQCGYLAGYAVVKEGFTKLGFSGGGGGTNPACCRYGYGFVQGANAAANELGIEVDVRYSWEYGSSYSPSPELQSMMQGWYTSGTEIVFACGGGMFQSITAAASANEGYVVGVDVDQSSQSPETVVTSAMKGLVEAAQYGLEQHFTGSWGTSIGGQSTSLGAKDDAVGLPTDSWSMTNYTVDEYNTLLAGIKDGSVSVDANYDNLEQEYSNLNLILE